MRACSSLRRVGWFAVRRSPPIASVSKFGGCPFGRMASLVRGGESAADRLADEDQHRDLITTMDRVHAHSAPIGFRQVDRARQREIEGQVMDADEARSEHQDAPSRRSLTASPARRNSRSGISTCHWWPLNANTIRRSLPTSVTANSRQRCQAAARRTGKTGARPPGPGQTITLPVRSRPSRRQTIARIGT